MRTKHSSTNAGSIGLGLRTRKAPFAATQVYAANTLRALKTQQRRLANGQCLNCGEPCVDGWRCERCKELNAIRSRNRARAKLGIQLDAPLYPRKQHLRDSANSR